MPMRIQTVLRKPVYVLIAVISALVMLGIYLLSQVQFVGENLDIWMNNVPLLHAFLLGVFVVLFGITFAYQIYLWRQPKACALPQKVTGSGISGVGTLGIFLVAQCPACASLGAFFLPVGAIAFIGQNTVWLNLLSIGLILFTLHYLGAFAPEKGH